MSAFAKEFGKRFLPGIAENILPRSKFALKMPASMEAAIKPAKKVNLAKRESHDLYKSFQYKADYLSHLSTMEYSPVIKNELTRRSKAYVVKELQVRDTHTKTFFGGKPHAGHVHWEQRRAKHLKE